MLGPRCMVLLVTLTACSAGDPREPLDGARQGLAPGFFIGNIVFDTTTYHWANPAQLLASGEGAGPRTLDIVVSSSVSPQVSWTGTHTPSHADISKALGYSVGTAIVLAAETSVLVPINAYARVSAYPTFQRATWEVMGFDEVFGRGVSYKPIGVYFDTCGCIGIDPCGPGCTNGFPPSGNNASSKSSGSGGKYQGGAGTSPGTGGDNGG